MCVWVRLHRQVEELATIFWALATTAVLKSKDPFAARLSRSVDNQRNISSTSAHN